MTERQVPLGPENKYCPYWQKPMSEVCHKCPLWTFMRMDDPRTGEQIDRWDCALAWNPILLVDLIRRQDRTTASVDKVANVVNETQQQITLIETPQMKMVR